MTAGCPIDIPPCACSTDLCPPIKTEENEMATNDSAIVAKAMKERGRIIPPMRLGDLERICRESREADDLPGMWEQADLTDGETAAQS
jgi:hypothetical protein